MTKEDHTKPSEEARNTLMKQLEVLSVNLLIQAHFRFKTFQEAMALAEFISELCPNKMLAHMGLAELFTNAVEHGNLNISSEEKTQLQSQGQWLEEIERRLHLPENQHKWVQVFFTREGSTLKIKVVDEGKGFDWQKYETDTKNLNLDSHGRGIVMAKDLAFKQLQYSGRGNEVNCIIDLKSS